MKIAIVTSCTGYGKYLADWADSICRLQRKPDEIGIFTHGTEADRTAGDLAETRLLKAGVPVQRAHESERLDLGTARNRAVGLTSSDWVMHLDADDTIMPHCLGDVERLAPEADAIALGYERSGDLAAGPRLRRKLYKGSTGTGVLRNPTPASGCSPFRRTFWERSPYRTDLTGGWDTALWLGFGHLGARIVATSRPCFWYRQHADSVFNTRRVSGWSHQLAGQRLESVRRGDHGVAILVPRSTSDGPQREAAWHWLKARYQAVHPDWQVIEGVHDGAPWSKAAAIRAALERTIADTLILADADSFVPAMALGEAVRLVREGAPWVVPHRLVYRMGQIPTAALLERDAATVVPSLTDPLARPAYVGFAGGGILVIRRADYVATGGIPKEFAGWGGEDEALGLILDTLLGSHRRLDYPLIHLWHPPAPNRAQSHRSNRPYLNRYREAVGNPALMYALVSSPPMIPATTLGATRFQLLAQRERLMPTKAERDEQLKTSAERFRAAQRERQAQRAAARQAQLERRQAKMRRFQPENKMLPGPDEDKEAVG